MKIELKIICDNAEQAAVSLAKLAEAEKLFTVNESNESPEPIRSEEPAPQSEVKPEPSAETPAEEPKKKAPRKSKIEKIQETLEPKPEDALEPSPAPASDAAPTLDDVRAALQRVMDKHGMPGATAFINEQGYKRVPEIPVDKFVDFISAANAKAAA